MSTWISPSGRTITVPDSEDYLYADTYKIASSENQAEISAGLNHFNAHREDGPNTSAIAQTVAEPAASGFVGMEGSGEIISLIAIVVVVVFGFSILVSIYNSLSENRSLKDAVKNVIGTILWASTIIYALIAIAVAVSLGQ